MAAAGCGAALRRAREQRPGGRRRRSGEDGKSYGRGSARRATRPCRSRRRGTRGGRPGRGRRANSPRRDLLQGIRTLAHVESPPSGPNFNYQHMAARRSVAPPSPTAYWRRCLAARALAAALLWPPLLLAPLRLRLFPWRWRLPRGMRQDTATSSASCEKR